MNPEYIIAIVDILTIATAIGGIIYSIGKFTGKINEEIINLKVDMVTVRNNVGENNRLITNHLQHFSSDLDEIRTEMQRLQK